MLIVANSAGVGYAASDALVAPGCESGSHARTRFEEALECGFSQRQAAPKGLFADL